MMNSERSCAIRVAIPVPAFPADQVREEDLIVVPARSVLNAAFAALVLTTPLAAQQPGRSVIVTAVTLDQAIKLSEQSQPSVVAAEGAVSVDEATVRARRGAFLPSLSLASSGSRAFSQGPSRSDPATGQIISGDRTSQSVSMSASSSLTLFDGFRRSHDLAAARANSTFADASLLNTKAQNALSVTTAFFAVLAAQQLTRVDSAGVLSAQAQFQVAVAKLQSGAAARSDSLSALVILANAQLALLQAQAQLVSAEASLGRLVGADDQVKAIDDSTYYRGMPALDTAAIRDAALTASPAVRTFDANVFAARASYQSSKSSYWPTLSLGLGMGYAGNNADSNYTLRQSRSLNLSLSWALFNGFTRELNIEQAAVQVDNANAQLADERRFILASVTQQFVSLASAQAQISVVQTSVDAATENLRVVMARYQAGATATIVDVNQAQQQLTQAQVNLVQARFSYVLAKAQLEALIGRRL
jgi:outer membrane protein TolC